MLSITLQKMGANVAHAIKRFPLAVASSILLTLVGLNHISLPQHWHIEALAAILGSAVFWFISAQLLSESRKWSHLLSGCVGITTFTPMAVYIYKLPRLFFIFPIMMLALGAALLMMIAPFLKANVRKEAIWQYNHSLWSQIFFSVLASLILLLGLSFLLMSLDYLFNIRLHHEQYFKLIVIMTCFVGPMMVMSGIPTQFEDLPNIQKGKGIQILLDYVMTPILLVFAAIIICYALKILALQNLPRGKVSYLVSILGVAGSIAYLLGDNGKAPHSLPHRLFRKHFFHLMIIPLILMGIGIGVRIQEYGVTEYRYMDTLLFLWLVLCLFHSFIASREKLTRYMLGSAASMLIISSFGPWGIMEVSARSQENRLHGLLEKKQILLNNSITKEHPPIDDKEAYEITSRLIYILNRGRTDKLSMWFGAQAASIFNQQNPKLISAQELTKLMDIQYVAWNLRDGLKNPQEKKYWFKYTEDREDWLTVSGYDYVLYSENINLAHTKEYPTTNASWKDLNKIHLIPNSKTALAIQFDEKTRTLTIKQQDASKPVITVSIEKLLQTLKTAMPPSEINKHLTLEGKEGALSVRLIIKEIRGRIATQKDFGPFDMRLMLFVKVAR